MKTSFLLLFLILLAQNSIACSCIGESSVEVSYKQSDLVVIGKVINVQKVKVWDDTTGVTWNYNPKVDTISFVDYKFNEELYGFHLLEFSVVVETSFKGASTHDTLKIWTGFGDGDCGFPFLIGERYLIYAKNEHKINYVQKKLERSKRELRGIFRTDRCSRTASLEDSADDLAYLRDKF